MTITIAADNKPVVSHCVWRASIRAFTSSVAGLPFVGKVASDAVKARYVLRLFDVDTLAGANKINMIQNRISSDSD